VATDKPIDPSAQSTPPEGVSAACNDRQGRASEFQVVGFPARGWRSAGATGPLQSFSQQHPRSVAVCELDAAGFQRGADGINGERLRTYERSRNEPSPQWRGGF